MQWQFLKKKIMTLTQTIPNSNVDLTTDLWPWWSDEDNLSQVKTILLCQPQCQSISPISHPSFKAAETISNIQLQMNPTTTNVALLSKLVWPIVWLDTHQIHPHLSHLGRVITWPHLRSSALTMTPKVMMANPVRPPQCQRRQDRLWMTRPMITVVKRQSWTNSLNISMHLSIHQMNWVCHVVFQWSHPCHLLICIPCPCQVQDEVQLLGEQLWPVQDIEMPDQDR